MRRWHRRVLVTVAGLLIFELGARIPLPGLSIELWSDLRANSIFALGILPYLSATLLMLLLSGLLPPLRRLREGEPDRRRDFDRLIMLTTAVLALGQGFGLSLFYESSGPPLLIVPPTLFQVSMILVLAAGALLTVTIARWITRDGLGNGVALLLIVGHGRQVFFWLETDLGHPMLPAPRSHHWLGLIVVTVLLVLFLSSWIRAQRPLRLINEQGEPILTVPLRPALTGVLPLVMASGLLSILATIPGLGPFIRIPMSPWWAWPARIALLIPFVWLLGRWFFDERDMKQRLTRWGLRPECEVEVSARLRRFLLPQLLVLALFILWRPFLMKLINVRLGVMLISADELIVITAMILEFWRVAKLRLSLPDDAVPVLESRVRLELEIARARLARRGIESWVEDDRIIGVTGSQGLWEVSKPRYPAIFNYPYLGGGRARLLLRPEGLAAAEAELDRWPG